MNIQLQAHKQHLAKQNVALELRELNENFIDYIWIIEFLSK
jgi:hypothetical protein